MILLPLWPILVLLFLIQTFDLEMNDTGILFFISTFQSAVYLGLESYKSPRLSIIYWIFSFTFLGLIPWIHYSENIFVGEGLGISEHVINKLNLIIIAANFITFFTYKISYHRFKKSNINSYIVNNIKISKISLLILSICGIIGFLALNKFDYSILFLRSEAEKERDFAFQSSSILLLLSNVFRIMPIFAFYFAYTQIKNSTKYKTLLLFIFIITVFPAGAPRYLVAYTYIPLILILFPKLRNGYIFSFIMILSLMIIFPFLDQFRDFKGISQLSLAPSRDFFFAAHFDAFENFGKVVDSSFISNGYQLLGALLFFVPRVFWPDKPVGSGYQMAENYGYTFKNLSMPYLGEGFVNFGYIGVVIFAIVIAIVMARIDKLMQNNAENNYSYYQMSIYYFLFGGLFFLLRGDLMSSFAYLSGSLLVAIFIVGGTMRLLNQKRS